MGRGQLENSFEVSLHSPQKFILTNLRLPQYARQRPGFQLTVQRHNCPYTATPHHYMAAPLPNLFKSQPLQRPHYIRA
jgi:hypothetical protein